MAYTPTTWATGDTITASAMNKIENGIAGAGTSYDLVIASNRPVVAGIQTISNWSIIKGSIEACEEKIDTGQPINAMAIIWDSQWSIDPPNDIKYYLPLIFYHAPYGLLRFGGILNNTTAIATNRAPVYVYANFDYDDSKVLAHGIWQTVPLVMPE